MQERFVQIRAQTFNSSERLNYMQTLQHASLSNIYQIILADIQTQTSNFMIKRIPRGFNIFTRKNKDVMFLFLYHLLGLYFTEAINSSNSVSKYLLFLIVLVKNQIARGTLCHAVLMGICPTSSHVLAL